MSDNFLLCVWSELVQRRQKAINLRKFQNETWAICCGEYNLHCIWLRIWCSTHSKSIIRVTQISNHSFELFTNIIDLSVYLNLKLWCRVRSSGNTLVSTVREKASQKLRNYLSYSYEIKWFNVSSKGKLTRYCIMGMAFGFPS